jgi:multiple sugar transport system substrate-binding protein
MFAIARTSKNPEAAFEFLKYMVSEEGIKEGLSGMQGIPARRSIAESASFRDLPFNVEHDTVAPFVASLPTVHRSPMLPNFNEVQDAVDAQLDSVWTLKESPETVLPKVCRAVTPKLQAGGAVGGG